MWCFLSLGYLATNLFGVQEKVLARKITPLNATKSVLVTNTATKSVHFTHSATKSVHNITDSVIKSVHITDSATKSVHNTKKRARATKSFIYATGLQKFKFCFVLIFIMNNMNIVKFVQGSFNQSHNQFGESAGKQCSCMALTACCWTSVRKTSIWKSIDLDFIPTEGDKVYKSLNIERTLYVDELPSEINILNNVLKIELAKKSDGLFSNTVMVFLKLSIFIQMTFVEQFYFLMEFGMLF